MDDQEGNVIETMDTQQGASIGSGGEEKATTTTAADTASVEEVQNGGQEQEQKPEEKSLFERMKEKTETEPWNFQAWTKYLVEAEELVRLSSKVASNRGNKKIDKLRIMYLQINAVQTERNRTSKASI